MQNNKPPIYGFCPAGCRWETVHKEDIERALNTVKFAPSEHYEKPALAKYRVDAAAYAAGLETLTEHLESSTSYACAATVGNNVYCLDRDYLCKYDTVAGTTEYSVLSPAIDRACCAAVGSNIYTIGLGASTQGSLHRLLITKYDTVAGTGEAKINTDTIYGVEYACCAAVGTKIYVFGGSVDNGSTASTKISVYDTVANTYTDLSNTLPYASQKAGAAAVGNVIYLFGLDTEVGYKNGIYKYTVNGDGSLTGENVEATVSSGDRLGAACVAIGEKIYIFGGAASGSVLNKDIREFDTKNDTISTLSGVSLESTVEGICGSAVGSHIVLFGGKVSGLSTNKIRMFNADTYEGKVTLNATVDGNENVYVLPIQTYDEYRSHYFIEILSVQDGLLVYELNGVRYFESLPFVGSSISYDEYALHFDGIENLYLINDTSSVDGIEGNGVPVGGSAGQVLIKSSEEDYDTEWGSAAAGWKLIQSITTNTAQSSITVNTDSSGNPFALKKIRIVSATTGPCGNSQSTNTAFAISLPGIVDERIKVSSYFGAAGKYVRGIIDIDEMTSGYAAYSVHRVEKTSEEAESFPATDKSGIIKFSEGSDGIYSEITIAPSDNYYFGDGMKFYIMGVE